MHQIRCIDCPTKRAPLGPQSIHRIWCKIMVESPNERSLLKSVVGSCRYVFLMFISNKKSTQICVFCWATITALVVATAYCSITAGFERISMENPLKTGLYATVCCCNNNCNDIADWSLSLYWHIPIVLFSIGLRLEYTYSIFSYK